MSQLIRLIVMASMLVWPAWAAAADCGSLSVARWVLGDWIAGGEKTVFHESWAEVGPQTFEGTGSERSIADGKLIGSEALRLVEMAGGVYYIAKVAHNELPVAFRLAECAADRLVFENPAHDFPRRLEYRHEADDKMVVIVSDGNSKGFTLGFERDAAGTDAGAPTEAAEKPELVFAVTFRTGPGWDASKAPAEQAHFADHSTNLRELRASGNILLGGRFGDVGLILLKAAGETEARALIERDPSVQTGVFTAEVQAWSPFMSGCTGKNASQ